MLYFAYGSNMARVHMKARCPSAKFVAAAKLKDHQLVFDMMARMWGGGVADVRPAKGLTVEGVLWDVAEAELPRLDEYEQCPQLYRRQPVEVEAGGKTHKAFAYVGVRPAARGAPSRRYLRLLIQGAEEHDLSLPYVEYLESIKTIG
jgi:gamma-glutamylcyclotransferase (GGCT)/AIG2-like uncharacterized protein YtfP